MEAKRILWLLSFMFFVCAVFLPGIVCGDAFHDKVINDRLAWDVNQSIVNFYYNPNDANLTDQEMDWARGGYAMACLYANKRNTNLSEPNVYIHALRTLEQPLPTTGDGSNVRAYWAFPSLWRMYLDTTMKNRMSAQSQTDIRSMIYEWVKTRSKLKATPNLYTNASSSTWYVMDTENHDVMIKSSFLLGCQALEDTNSTTKLADGNTVDQHYQGWRKYFYEYFRQRAREGLNLEVASLTYAIDVLQGFYNIRDYAADPNLRTLADNYLTLYWADYANDFLPSTGLRGASGTRWYNFSLSYGEDSMQDLLYAYDWHDNYPYAGRTLPENVLFYTSPYRVPDIVRLAGATAKRNPYLATTRRFGKGRYAVNDANQVVYILDANNVNDIRRDTWWTNDYVMGGLSLRTDADIYTHVFNQNRSMGILFSSALTDRMIFDGNGTMDSGNRGYIEITGVCGKNCLVGAWDKNAQNNGGTRIFIHDGPLHDNLRYDANNGWNFTQTGPYGGVGKMFVGDADANDPTRNNELLLGDKTASPSGVPPFTADGGGYGGGSGNKALQFVKTSSAVGDVAYATKQWSQDYNSVSIDLYFKSATNTDSNDQILATVPNIWQVYINRNNVKFVTWGTSTTDTRTVPGVSTSRWQRLQASVCANGNIRLAVDSNSSTSTFIMKHASAPTDIVLGNKGSGYTRWYNGLLDKVRINCPNMPGSPLVGGWNMDTSYTRDVYAAFRLASKTGANYYNTIAVGGAQYPSYDPGILLAFTDKTSPAVFEVDSAANYANYGAFQTAVKANNGTRWNWTSPCLTYTSLAGDTYKYYANSGTLPQKNGVNINLDPNKTFDCNTLQGYHGIDTRTITYGPNSLTLNFDYLTSPKWDDYQTVALWHMDSIATGNKILDDDLEHVTRNNDLTLYGGPTLAAGPMSNFGKALSLNGSNQYGQAAVNWASQTSVKLDQWFKAGDVTTVGLLQTLATASNTWELRQSKNDLLWYTWYTGGSVRPAVQVTGCITNTTTWHHVTASIDVHGVSTLTVDNYTPATATAQPLIIQGATIWVGEKGGLRYFKGSIDDIKIATYKIQ